MKNGSLLPWIVAFKAIKTVLLTALGVALIFSIQRDPVSLVWRAAEAVHVSTSSRVFDAALRFAFRATPAKEIGLAFAAFGYAVLMAIEGVGLYLRRRWARWFTIGATSSFIPIEVYEIVREPGALRVVVLLLNVAIVIYLFFRKEVFD